MSDMIEERLKERNIVLPEAAAPAASYLPYTKTGNLIFISGQLPFVDGALSTVGLLGRELDVSQGQEAARHCAINLLAQIKEAIGDFDQLKQVVKLTGFIASTPDFTDQHLVMNGASDFLAEILGDVGKHSRAAVGMASLPLNAAVEIEAIIETK